MRLLAAPAFRIAVFLLALSAVSAAAQDAAAPPQPPAAQPVALKLPEVAVKVGGLAQVDGRLFLDAPESGPIDDLLIRRARLDVQAKAGRLSAKLAPELGLARAVIQDLYVEIALPAGLKARVGKFTPPIGFERLQSAPNLFLLETGLASNLAPSRDVGLQVGGDVGRWVTFAAGLFAGAPDGGSVDGDVSSDKDVAGRVFVRPFTRTGLGLLDGLGLGVSASYGAAHGDPAKASELPTYKSDSLATIFEFRRASSAASAANTAWGAGRRARVGLHSSWFAGPAGIVAEYLATEQRVMFGLPGEAARIRNWGWQAAVICSVTGERASDGALSPNAPLDAGGWGALQVAARVSKLQIDDEAFVRAADPMKSVSSAIAVGGGLSWWPGGGARVLLDYVQTSFEGGAGTTAVADRPTERALMTRLQLLF